MARVLFYSPYSLISPHFETELELAQRHLDDDDDVAFLGCMAGLPTCDFNLSHRLDACLCCVSQHAVGRDRLSRRVEWYDLRDYCSEAIPSPPTQFKDLDEVRNYRIDEFEAGYAALSSTISAIREPAPSLDGQDGALLHMNLQAAVYAYCAAREALRALQPDLCYVFNARLAILRGFFRATQAEGVPCLIHERGATTRQFCLFEGGLPHDFALVRKLIHTAWEDPKVALREKERIGSLFYEERARAIPQSWRSYVSDQVPGRLPASWNEGVRNVVVFNSSEDEFAAIGESAEKGIYSSQIEGIERLADSLKERSGTHLWVRVHPNLSGADNSQTRALAQLSRANLTVVGPEESISTYAMLNAAAVVVAFGSTMGLEATYWGRPSVLLAPTFYSGMGGAWEPVTHEEGVALLLDDALGVADKTAALKYGYYLRSRGESFRYFVPKGIFEGEFRGRRLSARFIPRLIREGVERGPLRLAERVLSRLQRRLWSNCVFPKG